MDTLLIHVTPRVMVRYLITRCEQAFEAMQAPELATLAGLVGADARAEERGSGAAFEAPGVPAGPVISDVPTW